jgi:hypothetical protein
MSCASSGIGLCLSKRISHPHIKFGGLPKQIRSHYSGGHGCLGLVDSIGIGVAATVEMADPKHLMAQQFGAAKLHISLNMP